MPVNVVIQSGDCLKFAKVTSQGALVVSQGVFDETKFNELGVDDQVYNFYEPRVHEQFIITGILVFADKDVADNTDTVIIIYEASSASSSTVDKTLLQFGMGQLTVLSIVPLQLLINEGKFINAKASDTDIHMNIIGHYVQVAE